MGPISSVLMVLLRLQMVVSLKLTRSADPSRISLICDHIIAKFKTRSGELSHGATIVGERGTSARYRVERSHCTHRDLEKSSEWALSGRPVQSGRRRSRRPGRPRG